MGGLTVEFATSDAALGRKELSQIGERMIAERENAPLSVPEPQGLRWALEALSD